MLRLRSLLFMALLVGGSLDLRAQQSADSVKEAVYAATISRVADSAIRRLDFFPARAQVRAQMLFMGSRDTAAAVFRELTRRSQDAMRDVDEISLRFEAVGVPSDLSGLHGNLVKSLHDARVALERLAGAANACQFDPGSTSRCQSAFTSASAALSRAYARYLDVRAHIREQILDTQTVLPEFIPRDRAGRGDPSR